MDQRIAQLQYGIEHEHNDGSRGQFVEDRSHHDAADHDPERSWSLRRVFRCTSCDEVVTLTATEDKPSPDAE